MTADSQHGRYMEAAAREDRALQARLTNIRRREDCGEFTVRESADERIKAMEEHPATLRLLRERHLVGEAGFLA
jgi:hypothetical protein